MAVAPGKPEDMFVKMISMLAVGLAIQGLKIRGFGTVAVYWARRTSKVGLL